MTDTNALRQAIADQLERQPTDIIGSPSLSVGLVVNREINAALKHYEKRRFRWNEVREFAFATTASGTRAYTLPPDCMRVDTLKVFLGGATELKLDPVRWEELERRQREATAQGTPAEFAIYANVARVNPVPNASLTLALSYVRRFPPTSLTGSHTAAVFMGHTSLTVTSTASHNNRINGWTTDGEELIRQRACAAVKINYLRDETAKLEAGALLNKNLPFLSVLEQIAFNSLATERDDLYTEAPGVPPMPVTDAVKAQNG